MMRKCLSLFRFSTANPFGEDMNVKIDSYKAIHLTPKSPLKTSDFNAYMSDLLKTNQNTETSSIWVHLTSNNLSLIDNLINTSQFKFHHSRGNDVSLYRWMNPNKKDIVPHFSLHVVSCGGIIVKDDHVLLVREKKGALKGYYGVPGGRADPSEGIQECA